MVIHQMDSEPKTLATKMTSTANTRFDSGATVPFRAAMLVAIVLCAGPGSAMGGPITTGAALLQLALTAQGGEQKLRALQSVQWEAFGYRHEVEQSERPEGPFVTEFKIISEVHDFSGNRFRDSTELAIYPVFKTKTTMVVVDGVVMQLTGGRRTAGTPQQAELVRERVALSPERILLTALDSSDVRVESDTVLQSVPQNVLSFTLDKAPVRIYLNAYTHLPTAVDFAGPLARSGYWRYMGDVTMRTYYGFWWLAKGGLHFPMQWNIERNRQAEEEVVIRQLRIDDAIDEGSFTIPIEVREKFSATSLGNTTEPPTELAPGIILMGGSWNVALVRQDDGIVILEAPISPEYAAGVIAEAHRRFPGETIKAIVSTSDSWPHIAGVREYVAKGIPIYALDLNRPVLERMITAPHTANPDELQRQPRRPRYRLIHAKTILGTGANRLEIYPIRGETSERQMMVYFPEHHLLYGSDAFQTQGNSYFFPQEITELLSSVAQEHLQVDRFFMMHIGLRPWSDLGDAVAAAQLVDSPDGSI
jgi:hypothetical protein